jgi:dTDP-4-dehydrorhamnose 3,5-epimerase
MGIEPNSMNIITTKLPSVVIIEPCVFGDRRGFFLESFQADRYRDEVGIELPFVQDNHSRSTKGVLRGLHFQVKKPQGKLVRVVRGEVLDVVLDIDPQSPTYAQYEAVLLSEDNHRQLWVPPGYAHGFVVLSDTADLEYKCTDYYDSTDEGGVIWNDPVVGIDWRISNPLLSDKDLGLPTLAELNQTCGK